MTYTNICSSQEGKGRNNRGVTSEGRVSHLLPIGGKNSPDSKLAGEADFYAAVVTVEAVFAIQGSRTSHSHSLDSRRTAAETDEVLAQFVGTTLCEVCVAFVVCSIYV